MLVTHDRLLLESVATSLISVEADGRLVAYADLAQWQAAREEPASRPWSTMEDHLPPDKVIFLTQSPPWCRQRAAEIGPSTTLFVERLLGDRPMDRRRSAQAVLRLAQRYGAARLETACARALAFEELRVDTVRTILAKGLDREPLAPAAPPTVTTARHARPWTDFFPASNDGWRP